MSQILHPIEKSIIKALKTSPNLTEEQIVQKTGLSIDQIRRGIEWLRLKNLASVEEHEQSFVKLGKNGILARQEGIPERKLVNLIENKPMLLSELQKILSSETNIAVANAKKNGWIEIQKNNSETVVSLKQKPSITPEEELISLVGENKVDINQIKDSQTLLLLKKRPDFIVIETEKSKIISLTQKGKDVDTEKNEGAMDVEADVPRIFAARIHPLKDVINEVKEAFVSLGFTEIVGDIAQPSFWNFDALFTPQDHPAREMQDTFYIKDKNATKFADASIINKVAQVHRKGWKYQWQPEMAKKLVLRTHTTSVTIRYLADNKPKEARIFSLGRVFRNEKVSYKHLVEFHQVEGIVVGKHVSLRDLMGIQSEFYRKMGLYKIKFWPTFFPYTEPSLQTMVYNDKLGKWVELFGMGIFRQEVTKPLGITNQVLAWGGGIERVAMLKYGIDDIREFYNNNLGWLRTASRCL